MLSGKLQVCPVFCNMMRLGVLLLLLDWILIHRWFTSQNLVMSKCPNSSSVPIYTSSWREALHVRIECFTQENSTMTPAKA